MPRIGRPTGVALLLVPLVLASCYSFATPSYHPGEGRDLVAAIVRHGATVTRIDIPVYRAFGAGWSDELVHALEAAIAEAADAGGP